MKKVQLDKVYINILLANRATFYQYHKKHDIRQYELTVLLAISKVTSSNLGSTTITELKKYLFGQLASKCYLTIKTLTDKGYILSPSVGKKTKKYITLTDSGHLLLKQFHRSLYYRIQKMNDQLKLHAKDIRSIPEKRVKYNTYMRAYKLANKQ